MWRFGDTGTPLAFTSSSTAFLYVALEAYMQNASTSPENLATRTKRFAVAVIRLYIDLPKTSAHAVLGRQLLRSATSAGAQYREARRAKSPPDFINKIEGALQELDETTYWLELLDEADLFKGAEVTKLGIEANELISIFVSMAKRAKHPPTAVS